ncbi:hypothetical protein ACQ4M3_35820 [Leptolyngbya sp. AN03gr2]|uniref:hypothetical protein n=1 Tax=unclassified Leptolyngbya TaxID=2650499 RepID=UPI003D31DD7F
MQIVKVAQTDFYEWLNLAMQLGSDSLLEKMHTRLTAILNAPHDWHYDGINRLSI